MANSRLFFYHLLLLLLACLPYSCGGFPNSSSKRTQNQPQQQENQPQQVQVLPCSSCNDDIWLSSSARQLFEDEATRQRLVETIQAGRVYQHEEFLTPVQVDMLLQEIFNLQDSFARSGLSNTQKGSQQEFGSSDRFVCPVPWWKDSLLLASSSASSSLHDNTAKNNTVAMLLNKLRFFLSDTLDRPTMKDDPTSSSLSSPIAHECYYSVAHQGSILARHMDERHEECKGAKGWLLPSRRSLSWLIYLTDKNWTLEENGGGLRTFPQQRVQQHVSSTHEGNLQVGWLIVPRTSSSMDHDSDKVSMPVYLDSWFQPDREVEPHCILYTVAPPSRDTNTKIADRVFLTQAWLSTALPPGISFMDFIKAWAAKDADNVPPPPSSSSSPPNGSSDSALEDAGGGATSTSTTMQKGLFLNPEFARQFALLEERQEWDAGQLPRGCQVQDINPTRASLVVFDSVVLPHQVEVIKKGRRIAVAGWMHEATQSFPEDYYSTF